MYKRNLIRYRLNLGRGRPFLTGSESECEGVFYRPQLWVNATGYVLQTWQIFSNDGRQIPGSTGQVEATTALTSPSTIVLQELDELGSYFVLVHRPRIGTGNDTPYSKSHSTLELACQLRVVEATAQRLRVD